MNKKIKVAELFAGVGGFRLGLEKTITKLFGVINGNLQQKHSMLPWFMKSRFGKNHHSNEDISKVPDD